MEDKKLTFIMYPWYAMGHLTSFLHLSNKLADRGHTIFFIHPTNTLSKLEKFNLYPQLINFISITVPHVEGLPIGAETTSDIPIFKQNLLWQALDLTQQKIESLIQELKPHFILYDFAYWVPLVARKYGVKSIHYCSITPSSVGYLMRGEKLIPEDEMIEPPLGFPLNSSIKLHKYEARLIAALHSIGKESSGSGSGSGSVSFTRRLLLAFQDGDVIAFKTTKEIEGPYCEFVENKFKKPVVLAGPIFPEKIDSSNLEEKWSKWLENFQEKTVIFCAFGSECKLKKEQFQELVLGLELTGLPFFAALKPPFEAETIEDALPEGFKERIEGKGIVHSGWAEQQLILSYPSVGCFVTHCGGNSLSEAMITECELVLVPNFGDQFINARLFGGDLRVGVEVERDEENGLFTRESVCKAIKMVMNGDNEKGREIRANRAKWREFLLSKGLEDSYIDAFVEKLQTLL
ncbi:PREDICTED: anthocyanidin 3-O-glucoside 2''-O-glucosyltransferase-like [Nicotiana attenuata]|uniref:Anthocyanidin 3-o-glucoside 2''-o-glucosyltransferase n=1 Tax=Nicotiana attenuata TaxID=49451 RepID=A0A1J6I306_NICAT|nr:PREDICTED: anthocyanidin 3-O-glucoside 2''-O-glucosyltransferase-like [Nicotiana attenuata]XP_019252179.1 PREDICTED: anthocyanidin 3-O-glucoside 2''-O-glucosyltransferase-like [Nicotiana attenuata]OIS99453.1 anthocyanidin 3-o-glucoside 2''-o-glucosyltransferase [Nicotiana attenuata]